MTGAPVLVDRAAARTLFGLTRVDVDRVFTHLPVVRLPGSRKVYVRTRDLEQLLEENAQPAGGRR